MAARNKPENAVGPPQVPPEEGKRLLEEAIRRAEQLLGAGLLTQDSYSAWQLFAKNCLERAFGSNSANAKDLVRAGSFVAIAYNQNEQYYQKARVEKLNSQLSKLRALVDILDMSAPTAARGDTRSAARGQKIFLVHGHNEKVLQECARFLEKLEQDVVVLREQPSQGRTIIEKFEQQASDVGFAVVLLTADDQGGSLATPDNVNMRSRQNVIFELGYFVARLGRSRVCALHETGVELPSDYSGVIYEEIDPRGHWKLQLARELRQAGLPVDLNKL